MVSKSASEVEIVNRKTKQKFGSSDVMIKGIFYEWSGPKGGLFELRKWIEGNDGAMSIGYRQQIIISIPDFNSHLRHVYGNCS